jgi:benzil reductase ((S)-benzoin forming)
MLAVISGATSGIGQALALRLANANRYVVAIGRNKMRLDQLARANQNITAVQADVATPEGRSHAIAAISATKKQIQLLVHSAATVAPIGGLSKLALAEWQQCIRTNLEAPIFLTNGLLPLMNSARVVQVSSGLAHQPMQGLSSYCVSKAALLMAYQCYKLEFAKQKIRFASVEPGIVDTPMQEYLRSQPETLLPERQIFCDLANNKVLLAPELIAAYLEWIAFKTDDTTFETTPWDIFAAQQQGFTPQSSHAV